MRATDFFNEDQFGTEPKRPARTGSRPGRGHNAEPRYKSAPVVPGGDNPDADHKPIKGDEPVFRGDQVLVQDPNHIATVHSGTVKRIGREFVYVTLKNGETIAAPHDEVSKSYEALSKRAHLILNKKGKHVGNYSVTETPKLSSREKMLRGLKRGGYDVEERSKFWDEKVKEIEAQIAAHDEEMRQRKIQAAMDKVKSSDAIKGVMQRLATKEQSISELGSADTRNKVTKIQGKEYLLHALPYNTNTVKVVTDDYGRQVYAWVEKAGMRPQYTYYWFAPVTQEGIGSGIAKLAGITGVAGAAALGANYLDNHQPKVQIGDQQALLVTNPGWGTLPSNAMTVTGADGKQYKLWKSHGKGSSGQWMAAPVDAVKEDSLAEGIMDLFRKDKKKKEKAPNDIADVLAKHSAEHPEEREKRLKKEKSGMSAPLLNIEEECAGVGIVTKQNSTADVGPGTIKKNLKAFKLAQESHDDDDYVQQLTNEFIRKAKLGRRYAAPETILGMLDHFFKKFSINDRYFDDVFHRAVRTTDHEAGILEMEASLEEWKASRQLCRSSTPDSDLGASALSSCKSQGLRARDGNKSHKLGKSPKSRMKMGGHRIKGKKYGGPLPDWS